MRHKITPALAALAVACSLCVDMADAFTTLARPGLRPVARMPVPAGSAKRVHLRVSQPRGRAANLPFLSNVRAEAGEMLVPPPKEMAGAYVTSMDEYDKMYRQSLDEPEVFSACAPAALLLARSCWGRRRRSRMHALIALVRHFVMCGGDGRRSGPKSAMISTGRSVGTL